MPRMRLQQMWLRPAGYRPRPPAPYCGGWSVPPRVSNLRFDFLWGEDIGYPINTTKSDIRGPWTLELVEHDGFVLALLKFTPACLPSSC